MPQGSRCRSYPRRCMSCGVQLPRLTWHVNVAHTAAVWCLSTRLDPLEPPCPGTRVLGNVFTAHDQQRVSMSRGSWARLCRVPSSCAPAGGRASA